MRTKEVIDGDRPKSYSHLQKMATEFIAKEMRKTKNTVWRNKDGSYNWSEAAAAHLAELSLSDLEKYDKRRRRLHSRIHYKIWVEYESDRIGALIKSLQNRYDQLRFELTSFDVFGADPKRSK